jgi:hypothetical protein
MSTEAVALLLGSATLVAVIDIGFELGIAEGAA